MTAASIQDGSNGCDSSDTKNMELAIQYTKEIIVDMNYIQVLEVIQSFCIVLMEQYDINQEQNTINDSIDYLPNHVRNKKQLSNHYYNCPNEFVSIITTLLWLSSPSTASSIVSSLSSVTTSTSEDASTASSSTPLGEKYSTGPFLFFITKINEGIPELFMLKKYFIKLYGKHILNKIENDNPTNYKDSDCCVNPLVYEYMCHNCFINTNTTAAQTLMNKIYSVYGPNYIYISDDQTCEKKSTIIPLTSNPTLDPHSECSIITKSAATMERDKDDNNTEHEDDISSLWVRDDNDREVTKVMTSNTPNGYHHSSNTNREENNNNYSMEHQDEANIAIVQDDPWVHYIFDHSGKGGPMEST